MGLILLVGIIIALLYSLHISNETKRDLEKSRARIDKKFDKLIEVIKKETAQPTVSSSVLGDTRNSIPHPDSPLTKAFESQDSLSKDLKLN